MTTHASDCAVHNAPAMEPGPCDCGAEKPTLRQEALAIAIELFGEETSAEDAADLVAAAKVFEAYLAGE